MDVLLAKAVLVAVFDEALRAVHHENALPAPSSFLVEYHDAGGNTGAVKEVRRHADNAFQVATLDEVAADGTLCTTPKQHAVWENARALAGALDRSQNVQEVRVIALLAGWDAIVLEALPWVVFGIEPGTPAFVAEGRIGDDVIESLERVAVKE